MPRFQKYEKKIRKYKDKLKSLITRIGISYINEFELVNEVPEKLLLPCRIGVLFFGEYNKNLFVEIKNSLSQVFNSFFFSIKNLGTYNFSFELVSKGVKTEFREMKKNSCKIKIHPTNKFYQILMHKRIEQKLGIIIAITDLPLYSSSDDNIIFLFGETHLRHRSCIISSLKLKEQFYNRPANFTIFKQRIIKEVIHEIGHVILGPDHCLKDLCVMHFSHDVKEIDEKSLEFCNNCNRKLEQIRTQYNF